MNTITRVYELLDDRALSLTKLAEMSGVAYSTRNYQWSILKNSIKGGKNRTTLELRSWRYY